MFNFNDEDWQLIFYGVVALIILVVVFAQPAFEANTFNKLTGQHASYWDAMFSNLRITGCN